MGHVRFWGLDLGTRPGFVMTPRPASEGLVETALELVGDRAAVVADVGTGSGALAVAIAVGASQTRVWATDTSPHAVALARENVRRHRLGHRVAVVEGDLLDPVPGRVDLVVANLPNLPLGERAAHPELAHEPVDAVFAEGDGLGHYRRLLAAAADRLAPEGALVVQLRRRVLVAGHDTLAALHLRLDREAA
jgi:release factor glutamine methyltransferase